MSKKKTTTTVEEVDDELNYEEIHKDDIDEVARKAAASDVENDKNPIEEKAEELKNKPPEEEHEEAPPAPAIDPDKLKEEVASATSQKIIDALRGKSEEETAKNTDEYEEWRQKTFEETGKQPTWSQAADFIKEKAKRELQEEAESARKAAEEEQNKLIEQQKANEKITNDFIDRELEELVNDQKLPAIVNKDDKNDPGVIARKALFQTMLEVNEKNQREGKPLEYSVYKIFTKYYKAPRIEPPGADAPVSPGSGNAPANSDEEVKYGELKKPWYQFLKDISGK